MASTLSAADHAAIMRRITALSVAVAVVLIVLKGGAWLASGSVAVLASLADSGLDLVASLFTLFAVRYAAAPPDADHRFGHGKAEAFASLMQSGLVFASAAVVAREAAPRLFDPQPVRAEGAAIVVMILSLVLTVALVVAQGRALAKVSSVAVSGDRAHYLSDVASNLATLLGLLGTWLLGLPVLDAVAGLGVAAWLAWTAFTVLREAADQLMDRELPAAERAAIKQLAGADPRIRNVHELRTRAAGPTLHIQLHMELDPQLTLAAAHQIVAEAEARLQGAYPHADVLIHPDPAGLAEDHAPLAEPSR
jgi:cation diffusion facilitator family transporter